MVRRRLEPARATGVVAAAVAAGDGGGNRPDRGRRRAAVGSRRQRAEGRKGRGTGRHGRDGRGTGRAIRSGRHGIGARRVTPKASRAGRCRGKEASGEKSRFESRAVHGIPLVWRQITPRGSLESLGRSAIIRNSSYLFPIVVLSGFSAGTLQDFPGTLALETRGFLGSGVGDCSFRCRQTSSSLRIARSGVRSFLPL